MHMVTEVHMYKFRNAIIHAFSLPEPENGISITIANGSVLAPNIVKMDAGFKAAGHKVAFISPDSLLQMFIEGFGIMHPLIFKDPNLATQSDLDSIEKVTNEFKRRGAKGIALV